jgi:hypothetical protein
MTLQEKLIMVLYKTSSSNYASELLEKVADDYAVNFMKWFNSLTNEYIAMLSEEELLKLYKKENKL